MMGRCEVTAVRSGCWLCLVGMVLSLSAFAVAQPARPGPDHGSNFYLVAGVESLDFDLDPRGVQEFVDAGLDPRVDEGGLVLGVGWVFRRPLRLDLTIGGWNAVVDRPEVECNVVQIVADLHLSIAESERVSLEGTFSVGATAVVYRELPTEEVFIGTATGIGLTGRLAVVGRVGLGIGYQYQLGRFEPTTFEMPDDEVIRVQPTARMQVVRVAVYLDL